MTGNMNTYSQVPDSSSLLSRAYNAPPSSRVEMPSRGITFWQIEHSMMPVLARDRHKRVLVTRVAKCQVRRGDRAERTEARPGSDPGALFELFSDIERRALAEDSLETSSPRDGRSRCRGGNRMRVQTGWGRDLEPRALSEPRSGPRCSRYEQLGRFYLDG